MSLKSKLEAVIYAAEEPVTLTQLATLFGAEALQWKAEQEAAQKAAAEATTSAADPSRSSIDEGLAYLDLRTEDGRSLGEQEFADPGLAEASEAEPELPVETESATAESTATEADPTETAETAAESAREGISSPRSRG